MVMRSSPAANILDYSY